MVFDFQGNNFFYKSTQNNISQSVLHVHWCAVFFQRVKKAELPHAAQDKIFQLNNLFGKNADLGTTITICRQGDD